MPNPTTDDEPSPARKEYERSTTPYLTLIRQTASVKSRTGAVPFTTNTCELVLVERVDHMCHATLECGGVFVYNTATVLFKPCGVDAGAGTVFADSQATPDDGDPKLKIDLHASTASLGDVLPSKQTYAVTFRLQPAE